MVLAVEGITAKETLRAGKKYVKTDSTPLLGIDKEDVRWSQKVKTMT